MRVIARKTSLEQMASASRGVRDTTVPALSWRWIAQFAGSRIRGLLDEPQSNARNDRLHSERTRRSVDGSGSAESRSRALAFDSSQKPARLVPVAMHSPAKAPPHRAKHRGFTISKLPRLFIGLRAALNLKVCAGSSTET